MDKTKSLAITINTQLNTFGQKVTKYEEEKGK
jgi:hypothetical protein